jgi:recombination protein RecA
MNEEVLARLDKKTRERLQAASAIKVERQPTPSVGLNQALKGGIPYGRQTMLWGNKSAGKTSLMIQMMGMAQKEGKTCALFDVEGTVDPEWVESLGADPNKIILSQDRSVNKVADSGVDLITAGVDILVVDSISQVIPMSYFDDKELKGFDGTRQIGQLSRDLGIMMNLWNSVNENTMIVLISQVRNNIGTYTSATHQGGWAGKHNSAVILRLWSSEGKSNALIDRLPLGDKLVDKVVGRKVTWTVDFSKTSPMGETGDYDFYFLGDKIGVDTVMEVIDLADKMGYTDKSGNWYAVGSEKLNGKKALAAYYKDHPLELEQLISRVVG